MPNTTELKNFATAARLLLREQVAGRLEQVLRTDSAELREQETALKELRKQIAQTSKKDVIDRVAYIWFNRFCALRFMDVNRYTRLGLVSPAEGLSQPELLQEAKQGYLDDDLKRFVAPQAIFDLLNGQRPSADPQGEAYRLLLVAACNFYSEVMPFLFEKIQDYTELLMPLDLLSEHSVLHRLREALSPEACKDVEVIGWLYQFYIAERHDEVMASDEEIGPEDIPAATQLFTPHWIVRYLVENSLGRLWLFNYPNSHLAEQMEYYIRPLQAETDFLRIASPEEIRLADPACGSGHMLTYAFDLLYAIYEEAGYAAADIPRLILEKNLYGIEIDPRAGALAAFALFMKARAKDRRFFSRPMQPQICVLENVSFTDQELDEYTRAVGTDLFSSPLRETLRQFEQADNFGSLIQPVLTDVTFVRQTLEGMQPGLLLHHVHEKVLKVLRFADFLAPRFHVAVANPPYMSSGGLNDGIKGFADEVYPDSKSDLFAMFIERNVKLIQRFGLLAMITMHSWMFLAAFERLRNKLPIENSLLTMAHLGAHAFDTIGGEVVNTTAFIFEKATNPHRKITFLRLVTGKNEAEKDNLLRLCIQNDVYKKPPHYFVASLVDFRPIPGFPIAYWLSRSMLQLFVGTTSLGEIANPRVGLTPTDTNRFVKFWFEVSLGKIGLGNESADAAHKSGKKWFPFNKGGAFRKWYGNNLHVLNYANDGAELKYWVVNNPSDPTTTSWARYIRSPEYYFKKSINWTKVGASNFCVRYSDVGSIFSDASNGAFPKDTEIEYFTGLLNSTVAGKFFEALAPTLNFKSGDVAKLPVLPNYENDVLKVKEAVIRLISIAKADWDSFELSWDFLKFPIEVSHEKSLEVKYNARQDASQKATEEAKRLDEANNRLFIGAYGLEAELYPEVPLEEITLTWNPRYRYSGKRSGPELEALLLADTMKEFISYAVGCMFGRYSLDRPGLVLANAGETLQDYLRQVPVPSFVPDEDNAIPLLDGDWFSDDITERFKKFLRVTFGDEHYAENLAFIEDAIGREVRGYFVKEFYKDHVQMYKKRPIYWMFSSPKGSFNVLVYMHRYQPDTISVILNRYLREFRAKLEARKAHSEQVSISGSAAPREKTAAIKEIEKLNKTLEELRAYERDTLYPLAAQKIAIDLDDGVKVNYGKFGAALAKIVGL